MRAADIFRDGSLWQDGLTRLVENVGEPPEGVEALAAWPSI